MDGRMRDVPDRIVVDPPTDRLVSALRGDVRLELKDTTASLRNRRNRRNAGRTNEKTADTSQIR